MAQRGTGSDAGPNACPFIALELDRDRRSERPDYRHRCYAEQVPAPRTIAHQERFCLSPNFSGCPIFQDWAVRAAARPVPLPQGYEGRRAVADPRASAGAGAAAAAASAGDIPAQPEPVADEVWPDSMSAALPADAAPDATSEPAGTQQLSAFESAPPPPTYSPSPESSQPFQATGPVEPRERTDPGDWSRASVDHPRTDLRTPVEDDQPVDAAPVPGFLVGRSSRPRSSADAGRTAREEVVPSWELSDRFGAEGGGEPRGDGLFGRLFTIIAVVVILGLGVAAVVLVPGLLTGSAPSSNRPSFVVPSRAPTPAVSGVAVIPTLGVTIPPVTAEPTEAATPAPSPRLYRIKAGDTLAKIARKNRITVADILAANPQIGDGNHIEVGQIIVIPQPAATPAP